MMLFAAVFGHSFDLESKCLRVQSATLICWGFISSVSEYVTIGIVDSSCGVL